MLRISLFVTPQISNRFNIFFYWYFYFDIIDAVAEIQNDEYEFDEADEHEDEEFLGEGFKPQPTPGLHITYLSKIMESFRKFKEGLW